MRLNRLSLARLFSFASTLRAVAIAAAAAVLFSTPLIAQTLPTTPCRTKTNLPCQLPGNGPFGSGNLFVQIPIGVFDLTINSQFSEALTSGIRPDYGFGGSAFLFGHLTVNGASLQVTTPTGLEVRYNRQPGSAAYASEDLYVGDVSTISYSNGAYTLQTPQVTITYGQLYGDRYLPTKFVEVGTEAKSLSITYVDGIPTKIETGPFRSTVTLSADSFGHITSIENGATSELVRLTYHPTGQLASLTELDGTTQTLTYTADGNLASYTDRLGRTTNYTYYPYNVIRSVKDARGVTTNYSFTDREVITETSNASAPISFLRATFALTQYDQKMRLMSLVSGEGALQRVGGIPEQTFERDSFGAVSKATDATGSVTEYFYRLDGRCSSAASTSDRAALATCVKDSTGTISMRVDPTNLYRPTTTTKYTRSGQAVVTANLSWNGGVLGGTAVADGSGRSLSNTNVTFGAHGAPTRSESVRTTRYSYDNQGRLLSQQGPDGSVALTYGANGAITSVEENGVLTTVSQTTSSTGNTTITEATAGISTVTNADLLRRTVRATSGDKDGRYLRRNVISSQRTQTESSATHFEEEMVGSGRLSVKNSATIKSPASGSTATSVRSRSNVRE